MSPVTHPLPTAQAPVLPGPRVIENDNLKLHRLDSIDWIDVIQCFLTTTAIDQPARVNTGTGCTSATSKLHETVLFAAALRIMDEPVAPVQREKSAQIVFLGTRPIEQPLALSRQLKLHRCNAKASQIREPASIARAHRRNAGNQCGHVAPVQRRVRRWHATLIELRSEVVARPSAAPTLHRCNVKRTGMADKCERHKRKGADEISPFPFDAADSYRRVVMT